MAFAEFEDLVERRKSWVKSCLDNRFEIDSILSGLYSHPSHFIYEILQNAEDARAKYIKFILRNDCLEIVHDGRDFEHRDAPYL